MAQFRKRNGEAFQKAADEFLHMLVHVGLVDLKTLAIDGTKLKACAAREKMITAKRARQRIQVIEKYLKTMSERMDCVEAEENRRERPAPPPPASSKDIEKRVAELEAEDARRLAEEQASYDDNMATRQRQLEATGKTMRGQPPKPRVTNRSASPMPI